MGETRLFKNGWSSYSGNWKEITKIEVDIKSFNIDLHALFSRRIGSGSKCHFWLDKWRCNQPFKELFPNIFALENAKYCAVSDRYLLADNGVTWR